VVSADNTGYQDRPGVTVRPHRTRSTSNGLRQPAGPTAATGGSDASNRPVSTFLLVASMLIMWNVGVAPIAAI
jgi:hypothetical protein